jgi:hypothetical protein
MRASNQDGLSLYYRSHGSSEPVLLSASWEQRFGLGLAGRRTRATLSRDGSRSSRVRIQFAAAGRLLN